MTLWKRVARTVLPERWRHSLARGGPYAAPPQVGDIRWGDLRRLAPVSRFFGYDRGQPVDRYYIESFLAARSHLIAGRVLEVGDDTYTRRFGNPGRVVQSDVLHIDPNHPGATIIADLADAPQIPDARFDCIICTQTLHLLYDFQAAVRTLDRILAPGGVALVTVPGISPVAADRWGENWCWSFTAISSHRLFAAHFETVQIQQYGNVLAAVAFLQGLAQAELRPTELDVQDPQYPLIVGIEAHAS